MTPLTHRLSSFKFSIDHFALLLHDSNNVRGAFVSTDDRINHPGTNRPDGKLVPSVTRTPFSRYAKQTWPRPSWMKFRSRKAGHEPVSSHVVFATQSFSILIPNTCITMPFNTAGNVGTISAREKPFPPLLSRLDSSISSFLLQKLMKFKISPNVGSPCKVFLKKKNDLWIAKRAAIMLTVRSTCVNTAKPSTQRYHSRSLTCDENPRACSTPRRVFYPYANPSLLYPRHSARLDLACKRIERDGRIIREEERSFLSVAPSNVLLHQSDHYLAFLSPFVSLSYLSPRTIVSGLPIQNFWNRSRSNTSRITVSMTCPRVVIFARMHHALTHHGIYAGTVNTDTPRYSNHPRTPLCVINATS